jgi:uncharacterized repeat protein (TIGR01451 family)
MLGLALSAGDAKAAPMLSADLAIVSNTASVSHAAVGQQVTFMIVAKNNGPDPSALFVNTARVFDSLAPVSLTCEGVSNDGSWCEYDGVVQPGDTVTESVVAQVQATGSNYAVETACGSSNQINDPNPSNDCGTATVRIDGPVNPPVADLAIMSDTPSLTHAAVGRRVTFTIVAKNKGPAPAHVLVHALEVWQGLKFVSATCSGNGPWGRVYGSCEYSTVSPGEITTATIVGEVQAMGSDYASDTACMSSSAPVYDPDQTNDCATGIVRIDNPTTGGTSGSTTRTGGGSGGASEPVASVPPTGTHVGSTPTRVGVSPCSAYTRRFGRQAWKYAILTHRKLSCGRSKVLIRRADEALHRTGVYVKVSSWLCRRELRRSARHEVMWLDDCKQAGGGRLSWTEQRRRLTA